MSISAQPSQRTSPAGANFGSRSRAGRGAAAASVVLVDNYDSFTHNVAHALREAGLACTIIAHDSMSADALLAAPTDGLVLGPGPCTPAQAGLTLPLLRLLTATTTPVLGICLGQQALAVAAGGALRRAHRPLHGQQVSVHHDGEGLLAGLPSPVEVVRYNSLVVDEHTLPPELLVTARDVDGEVMGLRHRAFPIETVQFHPESWLDGGTRQLFHRWAERVSGCAAARRRAGSATS